MTPDEEKRLQEIEERVNAAGGGEWIETRLGSTPLYYPCNYTNPGDIPQPDIVFIGHSRKDIPWLIALAREKDDKLYGKGGE